MVLKCNYVHGAVSGRVEVEVKQTVFWASPNVDSTSSVCAAECSEKARKLHHHHHHQIGEMLVMMLELPDSS